MGLSGKRVLITGLHGFTGHYLAAELTSHGCRVFGLGTTAGNESDYYQADLTDAASLRLALREIRPEIVVHLAAVAFVAHGKADDFYRVNLIGTRNLLEAISACGKKPECVLLASSASVYGNASDDLLTEHTPSAPANDYAVSKLAMEYVAGLWKEHLPLIIVRPFNYTGVGQDKDFLLPKIVDHFRRRAEAIELGNLDVWRDFSDVRSVVQAYRRLIEVRPVSETINVCSGKLHSLREVISLCEEITGHSIRVEVNPAFVRDNEVKILRGSNERLLTMIGAWSTPPLRETLEWMLTDDQSTRK